MSAFGAKVHDILAANNKDAAWLSSETGISRAGISEWKTDPHRVPKPASLKLVAKALAPFGVTFDELAEAAGYAIVASKDMSEREERMLNFLRSHPRAPRVWERVQQLSPEKQDEVLSLVETWLAHTQRRGS